MKKHLRLVKSASLFFLLLALIPTVYASGQNRDNFIINEKESESVIILSSKINTAKVNRVVVLEKFLKKYNSPLAPEAKSFVESADRYGLDWRLLPSISGIESGFGKHLIPETYNPFGWGSGEIPFKSYAHCIETVAKSLGRRFASDSSPEVIGPIYTPPNYRNWIKAVNYFMGELAEIEENNLLANNFSGN